MGNAEYMGPIQIYAAQNETVYSNRSLHSVNLNLQHWKTGGQDPLPHLHLATRPQCLISRSERALMPLLLVAPSKAGQPHRDRTTLTMELTQATTDLSAGTRITRLEVTTTTRLTRFLKPERMQTGLDFHFLMC